MASSSSPSSPAPRPAAVIDGVVLAAGRSRRMGRSKALLPIGDETFVERAIGVLLDGGCSAVVVVVAPGDDEVVRLAEQAGALVVVNPDDGSDQASSLRRGLAETTDAAEAAAVLPVDHPLVRAGTIAEVLRAFRGSRAPIARPVHEGRPGHPGVFARRVFAELSDPDLPRGAHTVIERHAAELLDVPVDDPGAVADIDTPADYERFVEATR
jgi:molybdenum cofactor cytidylyltransferase